MQTGCVLFCFVLPCSASVSPSGKSILVFLWETTLPTLSTHKVWVELTSPSVLLAESWPRSAQRGHHTSLDTASLCVGKGGHNCLLMAGIHSDGLVPAPNQLCIISNWNFFFSPLVAIREELLYFHRHCLAGRKKSEDAGSHRATVKPKCTQEVEAEK